MRMRSVIDILLEFELDDVLNIFHCFKQVAFIELTYHCLYRIEVLFRSVLTKLALSDNIYYIELGGIEPLTRGFSIDEP